MGMGVSSNTCQEEDVCGQHDTCWTRDCLTRVRAKRVAWRCRAITAKEKVEPWDDTGFLKQETHSVGVQRQYTGPADAFIVAGRTRLPPPPARGTVTTTQNDSRPARHFPDSFLTVRLGAGELRRLLLLLLLCACAPPHPATRGELASRELTVRGDNAAEVAQALRDLGFHVVAHSPYRGELELTVKGHFATLRSDSFWCADADGSDAAAIARSLAASPNVASFIRNGSLPQQANFTGD